MAPAKKREQQRKAKERRQKQIALGGAVILAAVLAIQLPKLMKSAHRSPVTVAVTTTASASTPPTAAEPASPTTQGASVSTSASAPAATAAASPVGSSGLADTDPVQKAGQGQLVVFDRFESKNPFVQQLSQQSTSGSGGAGSGAGQTTVANPPTPPNPPTTSAIASILLSTNGVLQPVAVGDTFPAQDPTFDLVSATAMGAKIAIAGGSYADGSTTVTLVKGKPLTLLNTKTGARYTLLYVGRRK
jgi:hypothetical protein